MEITGKICSKRISRLKKQMAQNSGKHTAIGPGFEIVS